MATKKAPPPGPGLKSKFASVNLNILHKPVATPATAGATKQPPPKGLVALQLPGKDKKSAASKFQPPPPTQLKSLKAENQGNDPSVSLVPSGGMGWGRKADMPKASAETKAVTAEPKASSVAAEAAPKVASKPKVDHEPARSAEASNEIKEASVVRTKVSPPSWTGWKPPKADGSSSRASRAKDASDAEPSEAISRDGAVGSGQPPRSAQMLRRGQSWADQEGSDHSDDDRRRDAREKNSSRVTAASANNDNATSSTKGDGKKERRRMDKDIDREKDDVAPEDQQKWMKEAAARRAAERKREEEEELAQQRARAQEKLRLLDERSAAKKKSDEVTEPSGRHKHADSVGERFAEPTVSVEPAVTRAAAAEDSRNNWEALADAEFAAEKAGRSAGKAETESSGSKRLEAKQLAKQKVSPDAKSTARSDANFEKLEKPREKKGWQTSPGKTYNEKLAGSPDWPAPGEEPEVKLPKTNSAASKSLEELKSDSAKTAGKDESGAAEASANEVPKWQERAKKPTRGDWDSDWRSRDNWHWDYHEDPYEAVAQGAGRGKGRGKGKGKKGNEEAWFDGVEESEEKGAKGKGKGKKGKKSKGKGDYEEESDAANVTEEVKEKVVDEQVDGKGNMGKKGKSKKGKGKGNSWDIEVEEHPIVEEGKGKGKGKGKDKGKGKKDRSLKWVIKDSASKYDDWYGKEAEDTWQSKYDDWYGYQGDWRSSWHNEEYEYEYEKPRSKGKSKRSADAAGDRAWSEKKAQEEFHDPPTAPAASSSAPSDQQRVKKADARAAEEATSSRSRAEPHSSPRVVADSHAAVQSHRVAAEPRSSPHAPSPSTPLDAQRSKEADERIVSRLAPVDGQLAIGAGVVCVTGEELGSEDEDDGEFLTVKSKKQQKADKAEKKRKEEEEAKKEAKRDKRARRREAAEEAARLKAAVENGELGSARHEADEAEDALGDEAEKSSQGAKLSPRANSSNAPRGEGSEHSNESVGGASGSGSPAPGAQRLGAFPNASALFHGPGPFGAIGSSLAQPSKEIAAIWERPTSVPGFGPPPMVDPPNQPGMSSRIGGMMRPLPLPPPLGRPPPYPPPRATRPLVSRRLPIHEPLVGSQMPDSLESQSRREPGHPEEHTREAEARSVPSSSSSRPRESPPPLPSPAEKPEPAPHESRGRGGRITGESGRGRGGEDRWAALGPSQEVDGAPQRRSLYPEKGSKRSGKSRGKETSKEPRSYYHASHSEHGSGRAVDQESYGKNKASHDGKNGTDVPKGRGRGKGGPAGMSDMPADSRSGDSGLGYASKVDETSHDHVGGKDGTEPSLRARGRGRGKGRGATVATLTENPRVVRSQGTATGRMTYKPKVYHESWG